MQDVQNKEIMLANGWQMDISSNIPFWIQTITDRYCNSNTFYGFKAGPRVGKVMATFQGYGSATLDFGNCATQGYTSVFLNNKYIAHAGPNTSSKSISFQYNPGSTLLFNEFCSGIIKINSLKLDCICKYYFTYINQIHSFRSISYSFTKPLLICLNLVFMFLILLIIFGIKVRIIQKY